MTGLQEPVQGLWYGYDDDESGWGDQVSSNFEKIGALMQITPISKSLTSAPGSPADGDCYIVGVGSTGAWAGKDNQVTIWRALHNAWEFYIARNGSVAGIIDLELPAVKLASGWKTLPEIMLDADLLAIAALTSTGVLRRTGTNTWDLVTLGTAATADLTTSPTDTTSGRAWRTNDLVKATSTTDTNIGRVMRIGDWGLGSGVLSVVNMTAAEVNLNRFFTTTSGTTGGNGATTGWVSVSLDSGGAQVYGYIGIGSDTKLKLGYKSGASSTPTYKTALDSSDLVVSTTDATANKIPIVGYAGWGVASGTTPNSFSPTSIADMVSSISGAYRNTSTSTLNGLVTTGTASALPTNIVLTKLQYASGNSVYPWYDPTNTGRSGHLTVSTTATVLRNTENWNTDNLVKVSSTTDTTSGRMPTVGWAGLGGNLVVADVNSTYMTRIASADNATGLPVAIGCSLWEQRVSDSARTQFLIERTSSNPRAWVRAKSGGTESSWIQLYTTGNTSANVQTMLTAADNAAIRTAIDSSVFPPYTVGTAPSAASNVNKGIIVTDAASPGRRPFWSDGTNWRDAAGTILS